ncbi:MAG TPA: outer membrane protein assembly factor BamD [Candidatus Synoicihabitans sp.]|nr:outer membrane protein assembly factor BamD [Candidatus Synoicihabitans sp.]
MFPFLTRRLGAFFLFVCVITVSSVRADLVWTPQTGWRIEGGVLSGLVGEDARNALELMNRAREAEEDGRTRAAFKNYARVTKTYANSIYAPEAYYRTAKLRLARKQYYKAFEAYQAILMRYPNYERFNEVIGEQYRIATALMDGARNRILGVIPGFRNRDRAVQYFEQIVANAPYSDYAPLALMNVARAHQRMNHTPEAIDALDRMINNYPQSLLAPDAYLKLAQTHASLVDGPYYDQSSTREAVTYFEDYLILFPSDANLGEAEIGLDEMKTMLAESRIKMADFYFDKRSNYKAARVFYNEAITTYPDSPVAEKARAKLAEVDAAEAATAGQTPRRRFLGIF